MFEGLPVLTSKRGTRDPRPCSSESHSLFTLLLSLYRRGTRHFSTQMTINDSHTKLTCVSCPEREDFDSGSLSRFASVFLPFVVSGVSHPRSVEGDSDSPVPRLNPHLLCQDTGVDGDRESTSWCLVGLYRWGKGEDKSMVRNDPESW